MAEAPRDDWTELLESVIDNVDKTGTFAWSSESKAEGPNGEVEACADNEDEDEDKAAKPLPKLSIDGFGTVTLPLPAHQAAAKIKQGEPAPYGRGQDTVLDPTVRRCTQVDASRVHATTAWDSALQEITEDAAAALGANPVANVEARLYKLLLYEPGGHFIAHRDTEKEPGLLATVVVQLPVQGGHQGGSLRVSHQGQTFLWHSAAGSQDPRRLQYAAFYADCEHELSAVTAGLRMVLVYNLVRVAPGPQPRVPTGRAAWQQRLGDAVRAWEATSRQRLVAIPLEHQYTETNLSFRGLKGKDAAVVGLLQSCELLEVHLALLTRRVCGGVEGGFHYEPKRRRYGGWGRRWGWHCDDDEDDEDDGGPYDDGANAKMCDIYEDSTKTDIWVSANDRPVDYSAADFRLQEHLLGGSELFGDEPDEREYEGYTGNAGPTLEYIYHRAVAVIWPSSRSSTIACAAGFGAALDLLERRVGKQRGVPAAAGEVRARAWSGRRPLRPRARDGAAAAGSPRASER